jgi:hypothetical protein
MAKKEDLSIWVLKAVAAHKGQATIVEICKHVWENHETELRESGNLFYTWGYDIRWAGQWLRDNEYLQPKETCPRGVWIATSKGKDAASTGVVQKIKFKKAKKQTATSGSTAG